ncbi:MAG: hypothetical protein N4J56_003346 [Chroococcidiopsis sp. SAG 2025]|nr:rhomboid family intramembrane serine protease [Chroococcidiopsis sp. SAG 2025]MDV2993692.1 hypothetical protein [Chroococcidiopsis sp. SAG 2025]
MFFLGFWFVQQAFYGIASLQAPSSTGGGVAYWAHAGGFVFGAILAPLLGLYERDYDRYVSKLVVVEFEKWNPAQKRFSR